MNDSGKIQQIVEQVVSEVLQNRLTDLRTEVTQRVMEQLSPAAVEAGAESASSGASSAQLNSAALAVQNSGSQAEILSALLEGAATFCGRVALFVLRGNSAVGWKALGFTDNGFVKQITCDPAFGLAGRVIQDRMAASAAATEFSPELVKVAGNPADGNAVVVPLLVRDKVPALLYADRGTLLTGPFDSSALELLVRLAGLWLEVVQARRSGPAIAGERIPEVPAAEQVAELPEQPAATPEPQAAPQKEEGPPVAAAPPPEPLPKSEASAPPPATGQDAEVHKKAKRFAKLLVDEIRLYNQAKVVDGRQKKNLYELLKEDIEKSRITYDKRYGSSVAASSDYFNQELIRILADGNVDLLGKGFPSSGSN